MAYSTERQFSTYNNQTAMLTWLKSLGHRVSYVRDLSVPSIHLAPRFAYIGKPCPYCGVTMTKRGKTAATKEHMVPRCRGGMLTADNRLIVCLDCNNEKADRTLMEFAQYLTQRGDQRRYFVWNLIDRGGPR